VACFGQKDFQQGVLIRRMVSDLEMGVEIAVGPIVREPDGLAMSSRNVYLTPEERKDARGLNRGLLAVQEAFARGERSAVPLRTVLDAVLGEHPLLELQYAEAVEPDTLEPADPVEPGSVLVLAAHCGSTRLIDNHILTG
jgi:pantoate--beta-alanine ligase